MRRQPLTVGEPAPWFTCRASSRDRFVFDTVAGRHIVLCFFGSAADPAGARLVADATLHRDRFDDAHVSFFGVSVDPLDEQQSRVQQRLPGMRFFWDTDRSVSTLFGAVGEDTGYRRITYVLDRQLRVLAALPAEHGAEGHIDSVLEVLDTLPPPGSAFAAPAHAPVLVVPRVFEATLCATLIAYYESQGGEDSGFMRDVDGRTTKIIEYGHKRRRDCTIEDTALREACMARIRARLVPAVHRAFQFRVTRMERYIVACYDSAEDAHFRPHRDNTTKGTAHRRFAVSLFLNHGEYDGGLLRFPEFGPALYAAETGGAVVFACSLLHEATRVTRGRRFMFLPFLYDEAARRVRDENLRFLDPGNRPENDAGDAPRG